MNKVLSYYRLLNVDENASFDEIKLAYRKQALKYHPDVNNGKELSSTMFILVKNAYETLSEYAKRSEIDSFISNSKAIKSHREVSSHYNVIKDIDIGPWENDLNYLMWDYEDLISKEDFPDIFRYPVLDFITYLDKWVLQPAGFSPTPARDSREGRRDPRSYIDYFVNRNPRIKCDYKDIKDYFFNVRHRVMGFQSWTDQSLISQIKGSAFLTKLNMIREEIINGLIISQRIGFYYLFEIKKIREGLINEVEYYVYNK